jgi:hypothetical protein
LPESCHSGSGGKNGTKIIANAVEFVRKIGSGTHQAHLAFENVEKLWELVKAPSPKEAT